MKVNFRINYNSKRQQPHTNVIATFSPSTAIVLAATSLSSDLVRPVTLVSPTGK